MRDTFGYSRDSDSAYLCFTFSGTNMTATKRFSFNTTNDNYTEDTTFSSKYVYYDTTNSYFKLRIDVSRWECDVVDPLLCVCRYNHVLSVTIKRVPSCIVNVYPDQSLALNFSDSTWNGHGKRGAANAMLSVDLCLTPPQNGYTHGVVCRVEGGGLDR